MHATDLSEADMAIVRALAEHGNLTKGAIVDETGYSRNTVYTRLEVLQAGGVVECVHEPTRLFNLVDHTLDAGHGDPFERIRRTVNRIDPDDVDAFVAAVAEEGDGMHIQLDARRTNGGIDKQLTLLALYLRALSSGLDTSIEDVLARCRDVADDILFDEEPGAGELELEEPTG